MKTLHITNAYHATSGGVSTFYRALMQYANANGRSMRLVVPAEISSVENVGSHVIIYHVRAKNSPIADKRYRLLWFAGRTGRDIRRILRAEQPDLLEISDKYSLPLLAGFLRKNWLRGIVRPLLVATSHERMDATTTAYYGSPLFWSGISRLYMRLLYFPMFDAHIANSSYTAEELIPASKGHRLARDIRVLPMGVDADSIKPAARTPEARMSLAQLASISADKKMLLYVGRLAAEKNLPMLVELMDRLPGEEYSLILAGDGPLASWLQEQSERRPEGRICLIGHVSREKVAQLYAGADVFVHANPSEPFGIAPLEALAAGLPLVAPNAGGVLSYASEENAWLSDATPDGFANAVESLFRDPQLREHRSRRGREVAEEHNWPRVAARYFAQFEQFLLQRERWSE